MTAHLQHPFRSPSGVNLGSGIAMEPSALDSAFGRDDPRLRCLFTGVLAYGGAPTLHLVTIM